jgi:hypothetical protein
VTTRANFFFSSLSYFQLVQHVSISVLYWHCCLGGDYSPSPSSIDGASYNKPSARPSTAWFAETTSLSAIQIASAAAAATKVPSDATYFLGKGETETATIHIDWAGLSQVFAVILNYSMKLQFI